ncbi:MAG: HD domain-containing protein [Candidatus Thorarchaeota archaeon]
MKNLEEYLQFFSNYQEFNSILVKVYQFILQQFLVSGSKKSHSLEHTIRVTHTCMNLGFELNAKLDILIIAALFHDTGRPLEEVTERCHAELSAEIASEFLKEHSLSDMIPEVCNIILSHRFSKNIKPTSKEGKILKDADALDALGAMGLYRTISYSTERKYDLEKALKHFDEKLFKLPELMHFPSTKKLAMEKCKILKEFAENIEECRKKSNFNSLLEQLQNRNHSENQNFK